MDILNGATLQQMVIFLEVAQKHSFSQAAKNLNLTQTAVSKSLQRLSDKLGLELITGTNRKWELTEAGQILQQNWTEHLSAMTVCYESLRKPLCGAESIQVRIANFIKGELFSEISDVFRKKFQNIELSCEFETVINIVETLMCRHCDIIFAPSAIVDELDQEQCTWNWIATSGPYVRVPLSNPLSYKTTLTIDDLKDEEFFDIQTGPSYFRQVLNKGIQLKLSKHKFSSPETLHKLYNRCEPLMFVDQYYANDQYHCIIPISIEKMEVGIVAVWRKDNPNCPMLQKFVRMLKFSLPNGLSMNNSMVIK